MTAIPRLEEALKAGTSAVSHGKSSTYDSYKCRCDLCKEAHRERVRRMRSDRAERLRQDPSLAPHGRRSTYVNWECRCPECTKVHAEACRAYDAKRRAIA